mmetsp:Transcript_21395/g.56385  ORF Transcript_21395/g.56385 Transcript_21395/m.56385 type:complete len:212 (+) Transcript_21395:492-1127(+)
MGDQATAEPGGGRGLGRSVRNRLDLALLAEAPAAAGDGSQAGGGAGRGAVAGDGRVGGDGRRAQARAGAEPELQRRGVRGGVRERGRARRHVVCTRSASEASLLGGTARRGRLGRARGLAEPRPRNGQPRLTQATTQHAPDDSIAAADGERRLIDEWRALVRMEGAGFTSWRSHQVGDAPATASQGNSEGGERRGVGQSPSKEESEGCWWA